MGWQGSEQQRRAVAANMAEAEFSTAQREKLAEKGHALPDGSYPIRNASDLKNAIQALGRAKNRAAAMAHIRQRAKALGLEKMLGPTLQESESSAAYNILHPHDRKGRWARTFTPHIGGYPVEPRTGKFLPTGGSAGERRREVAIKRTALKREAARPAERVPLMRDRPQGRPIASAKPAGPKPAGREDFVDPGAIQRNLDRLSVDMFASLENRREPLDKQGRFVPQHAAVLGHFHERIAAGGRPTKGEHRAALAALDHVLPDIAGTSASIQSHKAAPLSVRLDYNAARGQALAAFGTTAFPEKLAAAKGHHERVLQAIRGASPPLIPRARAESGDDWLERARQENRDRQAHHRAASATAHNLFASGKTTAHPDTITSLAGGAPSRGGGRYVIHHATGNAHFPGQGRGPEYEITHREVHPEHHSAAGFARSRNTGQIVAWRQVGPRKQGTRMVPVDVAHAHDTGASHLEFDWSKAVRLHANEEMGVSTEPHEWQALHGSTRPKSKGQSPVGPVPEDRQMPKFTRSELAAEQRAMRHRQPDREHMDAMRQGMLDVGGHRDLIDAFATGTADEEQWQRASRFLTNSRAALKDGTHPWIANERDPVRMGESVRELRRVHRRIAAALAAHRQANRRASR
jgi:hypothetical protein